MQGFEDLGSALQLLGCTPLQVEPRWLRPTPKCRPGSSVQPGQSRSEAPNVEATTDPYQVVEPATTEQTANLRSSLEKDPGPSNSESSFEVVPLRALLDAEPAAVSSAKADEECHAILPVASSQSSCAAWSLGQRTVVRPVVTPALPRLSDPARRPLSLRMPNAPAVRHGPKPKFSQLDMSFTPLQRPVPLRAADYHRPRPLLPPCQAVAIPAVQPSSVLSAHLASSKKSSTWVRPGEHNSRSGRQGVCLQQDLHAKVLANALKLWSKIRPMLHDSSQVLQELEESRHPQELERRLLTGVSENTLFRYLQGVAKFLSALGALGLGMLGHCKVGAGVAI